LTPHWPPWIWIAFNAAILALLIFDLGVVHRRPRVLSIREALVGSAGWISLALLFNVGIWFFQGPERGLEWPPPAPALEFLTGYLIELSLSVDNLFVFLAIFTYFGVRPEHQHRVLFWGILGAIVLRITLILAGIKLIEQFHWMVPVLGAFLVITGIRLVMGNTEHVDFNKNIILRVTRRILPMCDVIDTGKFFLRQNGKLLATPLFLVLILVDVMDVVFALDSVPAILAITRDSFIVYSSNTFAILGLRTMYFAIAGMMRMFAYLKFGLAAILVFVGIKMLVQSYYHIPVAISLSVVVALLGLSVLASILWAKPETVHVHLPADGGGGDAEAPPLPQPQESPEHERV
jgi:tellurite resistance protein TerC